MRSLFLLILAAAVLGLAAYGAWQLMPHEPAADGLGPLMGPLLDRAVARAVAAAPREAFPVAVYVLPFRGDVRDLARAAVIGELERGGQARIIAQDIVGSDLAVPLDLAKAGQFLKRFSLPGLILGDLSVEESGERGTVRLTLRIMRTPGAVAYEATTEEACPKNLLAWPFVRASLVSVSLGWRLLGWTVFVLVLPVALSPLLMRRLRRESNLTNAVSLVALTAMSALALWGLLAFSLAWPVALAVGVLGIGLAGVYHFLVVDLLEDLRR